MFKTLLFKVALSLGFGHGANHDHLLFFLPNAQLLNVGRWQMLGASWSIFAPKPCQRLRFQIPNAFSL